MNVKFVSLLLLVAVIGAGSGYLVSGMVAKTVSNSALKEPDSADFPPVELADPNGDLVAVTDYMGEPLLINFWATWCKPCVKEMPMLDRIAREHDLKILGIALDQPVPVVNFLENTPVDYPILIDTGVLFGQMAALGNPNGVVPYSVFLDADGNIVHQELGELEEQATVSRLQAMLAP